MNERLKRKENFFTWTLVILMIISLGFLVVLFKRFPLLPISILLLALPLIVIVHYLQDLPQKHPSMIEVFQIVCVFMAIALFFAFFQYDRGKAYVDQLFLGGKVKTTEEFVPAGEVEDQHGRTADHYERRYGYDGEESVRREVLEWVYFAIVFGMPILCLVLYGKAENGNKKKVTPAEHNKSIGKDTNPA